MNITRKFLNFQLTAGIVAHGTFQNFSGLEIIHALCNKVWRIRGSLRSKPTKRPHHNIYATLALSMADKRRHVELIVFTFDCNWIQHQISHYSLNGHGI